MIWAQRVTETSRSQTNPGLQNDKQDLKLILKLTMPQWPHAIVSVCAINSLWHNCSFTGGSKYYDFTSSIHFLFLLWLGDFICVYLSIYLSLILHNIYFMSQLHPSSSSLVTELEQSLQIVSVPQNGPSIQTNYSNIKWFYIENNIKDSYN